MSLRIENFIEEMRATSSSTDKVQIIKEASPFIHKALEYTYNPFKQFYVTSKTCIKNSHLKERHSLDLFEVLDKLMNREVTGHDAIKLVNGLEDESIYKIIDKNLDIRAGDKVINKAVPNLIPTFSVALAKEYDGKCDWKNDNWWASRKLDGVRCLAVVNYEGECTLYSRMGKELTTLNRVKEAIENTGIVNYVFDGEICLMDEDGNEDFQSVMKQLRRKDHQIENPAFMIFDGIYKPDFDKGKSKIKLSDRLSTLRTWLYDHNSRNPNQSTLRYLDQAQITDGRHFDMWGQMASDGNWEGFMLRKDVGYEGKRSKNLLKVKTFHDAEYEVIDCDFAPMSVVRDGKEAQEIMLSQVYIEHKGYKVKVGSGFSQEQRIKYKMEDIVGKTITVQYFEETANDKGGISLRFPTVKHIYDNKRDC